MHAFWRMIFGNNINKTVEAPPAMAFWWKCEKSTANVTLGINKILQKGLSRCVRFYFPIKWRKTWSFQSPPPTSLIKPNGKPGGSLLQIFPVTKLPVKINSEMDFHERDEASGRGIRHSRPVIKPGRGSILRHAGLGFEFWVERKACRKSAARLVHLPFFGITFPWEMGNFPQKALRKPCVYVHSACALHRKTLPMSMFVCMYVCVCVLFSGKLRAFARLSTTPLAGFTVVEEN